MALGEAFRAIVRGAGNERHFPDGHVPATRPASPGHAAGGAAIARNRQLAAQRCRARPDPSEAG